MTPSNEARIIDLIKERFCQYVQPGTAPERVEVKRIGWLDGAYADTYPYFLLEYKEALKGHKEIRVSSSQFDSQIKRK